MKPTLVIMAAGMGSRYGGLKQIEGVGPGGERIIDYSLYDAKRAGFGKIVFIIRRDIEAAFREAMAPAMGMGLPVEYVDQDLHDIPSGLPPISSTRVKPWGTGHAIWCCRHVVKEPFGVINADDFYGADAFRKLAQGLAAVAENPVLSLLVGYPLSHTLSMHGAVSRGVCAVTPEGWLSGIVEKTSIQREGGCIVAKENNDAVVLAADTIVSMNMWGFAPAIFDAFAEAFRDFYREHGANEKAEFFIPSVIQTMLRSGTAQVMVARTDARWMGMTYPEDRELVRQGITRLVNAGRYPHPLWP